MEYGSPVNRHLMGKYESLLSNACKYYDQYNLTRKHLVDLIVAGERFELQTLLSSAIELASKCKNFDTYVQGYHEISDSNKLKIAKEKLYLQQSHLYTMDITMNWLCKPLNSVLRYLFKNTLSRDLESCTNSLLDVKYITLTCIVLCDCVWLRNKINKKFSLHTRWYKAISFKIPTFRSNLFFNNKKTNQTSSCIMRGTILKSKQTDRTRTE